MARVSNINVYGLNESLVASGYPMRTHLPPHMDDVTDGDKRRATKLAKANGGGHDQFLTGIIVQFDLTASNKAWVELERYRFLSFVSSMSTMHRLQRMDIANMCNEYVDEDIIKRLEELQEEYHQATGDEKEEARLKMLYNTPSGLELTARLTTNYRCLKNIYEQRRHHALPDWQVFCDFIEQLPFSELITS